MAETTRAKPRLSRIQRSKWEELGWSELAGVELVAAAGARPLVVLLLQRASGETDALARRYEVR